MAEHFPPLKFASRHLRWIVWRVWPGAVPRYEFALETDYAD